MIKVNDVLFWWSAAVGGSRARHVGKVIELPSPTRVPPSTKVKLWIVKSPWMAGSVWIEQRRLRPVPWEEEQELMK